MNRSFLVSALSVVLIIAVSSTVFFELLQAQQNTSLQPTEKTLYQTTSYAPFAQGNFVGNITYYQLKQFGDFGIGTFNGMDGEMACVDGVFYQIRTDGVPRAAEPSLHTPYACVTFFEADQTYQVTHTMNFSGLTAYIDSQLPTLNSIYAIRIFVNFSQAQTRSIPSQIPPYPTLAEVVANQTTFNIAEVTGTMVGYRFPDYLNGANTAGYHFHFVADSKAAGGHLLNGTLTNATIEIDRIDKYVLLSP